MLLYSNNSYCFELSDLSVSRSGSGVLSNFDGPGLGIRRMILAENSYNTKLGLGHEGDDVVLSFTDIVFMALARPNCASCYNKSSSCSNMKAVLVPIVQISGKNIPIEENIPDGILPQCKESSFDSKLMLNNVEFINYKLDYQSDNNINYRLCKNNIIFDQNSIPDSASRIFLKNAIAKNSTPAAYIILHEPPQEFLFWRGGCGDFNCSGNKNWLLTDLDGSFLGAVSQIVPQTEGVEIPGCQDYKDWNGKLCPGMSLGILEFQNDGPDQRLRLIAPLNISSRYMKTTLNQWREWQWLGSDPKDKRLSRFNGKHLNFFNYIYFLFRDDRKEPINGV